MATEARVWCGDCIAISQGMLTVPSVSVSLSLSSASYSSTCSGACVVDAALTDRLTDLVWHSFTTATMLSSTN